MKKLVVRAQFVLCAWFTLVAVSTGLAEAPAAPPIRVHPHDVAWIDPQLEQMKPMEIAVLPAVTFVDDPAATRLVEVYGALLVAQTGHYEQAPWQVREAMERLGKEKEAFCRALTRQVQKSGTIDSRLAATLARITGAPMFMSLRIDEWDIVDGRAEVVLTATLVDSTGRLLWKIRGRAGDGGGGPSAVLAKVPMTSEAFGSAHPAGGEAMTYPHGQSWSVATLAEELRIEPRVTGDLERALRSLVSRWIPAMPMGDPDSPGIDVAAVPLKPPTAEH
jgi:hypothetical protein